MSEQVAESDDIKDLKASRDALKRDRCTCRLALPGICTARAQGVHHIYPRGDRRLRWFQPNLLSVCGACHGWADWHQDEMLVMARDVLLSADEWEELNSRRLGYE